MLVRLLCLTISLFCIVPLTAQETATRQTSANWPQASRFSSEFVRQFTYDTSVFPQWIGKTDNFWYQFRDSKGTHFWKVDPKAKLKVPLFDHAKLAGAISAETQKPVDAFSLSLSRVTLNDEGTKLKFVLGENQYEWDLTEHKLTKLGKAPPQAPALPPGMAGRELTEEQRREIMQRFQERNQQQDQQQQQQQDQQQQDQQQRQQQDQQQQQQTTGQTSSSARPGFGQNYRNYSPDRKVYLYAYKHNLYLVKGDKENEAIQITKDGAEDFSFAGGGFGFGQQNTTTSTANEERKTRPNVTWSEDSKHFYIVRSDTRGMGELFLVNTLSSPRPQLEKYKYGMPGEEKVRKQELFFYGVETNRFNKIAPKWKDESYNNIHWQKGTDELRFVRYDRLRRNLEVTAHNLKSYETKVLLSEGFEAAYLEYQPIRYVEESDDMIWWSERTGWAHLYLYDKAGKFKNALTSGNFRVSRVVNVDGKNRTVYFLANGREEGENIYYNHLYSVRFDGTGLTLLDPGNATHNSVLSPSRQFLVDNTSRVDQIPTSTLRDSSGNTVMELEKADLSRLMQAGWKLPETFVVKASDGVTDLYGNLWKPFDFDPKKKYPIIANVYPGPQTEGVTHTFAAYSTTMQMAQLGFIVIQVGHRGGTPQRSKAYASFGYFNMRDYALADKKYAIEQLAVRFPWMDVDRVGIYGHSGGGFFSAAAMLVPPYNDFFKAAVASAGNHDNNVYNDSWAERYHGLKEVPADKKEEKSGSSADQNQNQNNQQQQRRGVGNRNRNSSDEEDGYYDDEFDFELDMLGIYGQPRQDATKKDEKKAEVKADEKKQETVKTEAKKEEVKKEETKAETKKVDAASKTEAKKDDAKKEDEKKVETKKDESKKSDTTEVKKEESKKEEAKKETKFEIKIPTNAELAGNLKGHLLLVHGDMDNNVHPAGTMRLVDALIKANKRFEMIILPGKRHGFADAQPYFTQRMWEFFAEHLLEDRQTGADILQKKPQNTKK